MLNEEQNKLIEQVALENGFRDYSVSVEEGSKKGDNYLGNIYLVCIKEKQSPRKTSLILKGAIKNEQVRSQIPIYDCYEREIFLYDSVLSAFKEFQKKHPLPHKFTAFAKIYGSSLAPGDEWLLLEDIRNRGFKMMDRKIPMDGDHVSIVFKELARLHSISFAMNHVQPEEFKKLTVNLNDYMYDNHKKLQESFFSGIKTKFINAYKTIEGNLEATEGLKRCERDMQSIFDEIHREKNGLVVIHGDSWCNNMMFNYADVNNPRTPTGLCFLDWQISRLTIPVADLCYFLFLSASKEVLDHHKVYLQQYHRVLEENLRAVGCDVNSLFPYEVFLNQWNKYCKMGLYIALAMIETLTLNENEAKTFSDVADDGKDILETFVSPNSCQSDESKKRIKDIILMLTENKYM